MKEEFIELLRSTNREGMDKVIAKLEKMGFFTAPASSKNHLCREGGLVEHSLNVYKMAKMIHGQLQLSNPEIKIKEESVIIASLLHDVCKADIYKIGVKWRKDDQGRWEQYEAYEIDYTNFPMGHGEKSVMMLLMCGLRMEQDELLAIRWHMGFSEEKSSYKSLGEAMERYPIVLALHEADLEASKLMEDVSGNKLLI
jgi:hypothetical protein